MTDREKYLTILDRFYRGRGGSLLTKDESEALYYAISSIKTDLKYDLLYEETKHIADADKIIESTTKNDLGVDCISRDEVCRYVAEFVNHEFSTRVEEELIDNIITGIERMPSVTSQTRKGYWIPVYQGDEIIDYRCSCCEFGNTFGKGTVGMNYCPRCGSRNEVEK